MKRFKTFICAAMAATFAAGTALPVAAAPMLMPSAPATSGIEPIQVQTQRQERRFDRREERRERRFERRQDRREDRREARFERRNGNPYYGNYRGYRERRSGYRLYNGFWFPAAAFVTGAIVGGAISGGTVVRPAGSAHVAWCNDRWRSYRAYDNSYQPTSGPRRACVSPYS